MLSSYLLLDLPNSFLLPSFLNKTLYAPDFPTCYNLTYAFLKALILII